MRGEAIQRARPALGHAATDFIEGCGFFIGRIQRKKKGLQGQPLGPISSGKNAAVRL
jgi:hypothetical protein